YTVHTPEKSGFAASAASAAVTTASAAMAANAASAVFILEPNPDTRAVAAADLIEISRVRRVLQFRRKRRLLVEQVGDRSEHLYGCITCQREIVVPEKV